MEEELFEAFKTFDTDTKGYFNVTEMQEFMEKYGEKISDEEAESLFRSIDADHDEKINFEEFVLMMMAK